MLSLYQKIDFFPFLNIASFVHVHNWIQDKFFEMIWNETNKLENKMFIFPSLAKKKGKLLTQIVLAQEYVRPGCQNNDSSLWQPLLCGRHFWFIFSKMYKKYKAHKYIFQIRINYYSVLDKKSLFRTNNGCTTTYLYCRLRKLVNFKTILVDLVLNQDQMGKKIISAWTNINWNLFQINSCYFKAHFVVLGLAYMTFNKVDLI